MPLFNPRKNGEIKLIDSNYTALSGDYLWTETAAVTVMLPAAGGGVVQATNSSTADILVAGNGNLIENVPSRIILAGATATYFWDGSQWRSQGDIAGGYLDPLPAFASNTQDGFTLISSPTWGDRDAWRAFDKQLGGIAECWMPTSGSPHWLEIQSPQPLQVAQFDLRSRNSSYLYNPIDFEWQIWDGANWVAVLTRVGEPAFVQAEEREFEIPSGNRTASNRNRFYCSASSHSSHLALDEIKILV